MQIYSEFTGVGRSVKFVYNFKQLEANDVLPNINRTHCRREHGEMPSFVPGDLAFKLVRARDQTHFPCEFGANRSAVPEIFHTID